jgi:transposase InsO family protein
MRVSSGAYYAYASGKSYVLSTAKAALAIQVREVFEAHRRRYGARRIAAELKAQQVSVGRSQVRSLMKRQGLRAIAHAAFVRRRPTAPERDTKSEFIA